MDNLHLILKNEWRQAFAEMDDAALGKLVKALFAYHAEGSVPADLSGETKALFLMTKPFLDLNRERYESRCRPLKEHARRRRKKKDPETEGVARDEEENDRHDEKKHRHDEKNVVTTPKPKRTPKRTPTGTVSDETVKESERESAAAPPFLSPARAPALFSGVLQTKGERCCPADKRCFRLRRKTMCPSGNTRLSARGAAAVNAGSSRGD